MKSMQEYKQTENPVLPSQNQISTRSLMASYFHFFVSELFKEFSLLHPECGCGANLKKKIWGATGVQRRCDIYDFYEFYTL
jgi:hypothetical protein